MELKERNLIFPSPLFHRLVLLQTLVLLVRHHTVPTWRKWWSVRSFTWMLMIRKLSCTCVKSHRSIEPSLAKTWSSTWWVVSCSSFAWTCFCRLYQTWMLIERLQTTKQGLGLPACRVFYRPIFCKYFIVQFIVPLAKISDSYLVRCVIWLEMLVL